jgi:DNA repair photolyase
MVTRSRVRAGRPAEPADRTVAPAAGTRLPPGGSAALIERLGDFFPPARNCERACAYCGGALPRRGIFAGLVAEPSGPAGPVAVLGANGDPYGCDPAQLRATRSNLEALRQLGGPLAVVTRSARILRDLDVLVALAQEGRLRVFVAVGTLDAQTSHRLEPRADDPQARIEAIRRMARAGLHAGVLLTPVIPGLTSTDVEAVLEAAASAGAGYADMARFSIAPQAKEAFARWLRRHYPQRSKLLLGLMQALEQDVASPRKGSRPASVPQEYAEQIAERFDRACRRLLIEPVPSPPCCGRLLLPDAG